MTPRLRKIGLTAHITVSVGWLGAVAAFLVLSIVGVSSQDAETVRGAYLAMNLIGKFIVVPLSLATLATGLIQGLGTDWGLFRYYWVLVKLVLTIGATILLLLHQFTAVEEAANRVSGGLGSTLPSPGRLGIQLLVDASLAILVLLMATILSVFKPWGLIRKRERELAVQGSVRQQPVLETTGDSLGVGLKIFIAAIAVVLAIILALHLAGGGLGRHSH